MPCTDYRASAMIRYRARDGQRIRFLHDEWCGLNLLLHLFPNLYLLDRNQEGIAAESLKDLILWVVVLLGISASTGI